MFGLPSLGKLLVLVLAVLAVWYGFKLYGRLESARQEQLRKSGRRTQARTPAQVDTIECPRCGTYVPAGVRADCERKDCPLA